MKMWLIQRIGGGNEIVYLAKYNYNYTFTSKIEHARKLYRRRDAERIAERWVGAVRVEVKEFNIIEVGR